MKTNFKNILPTIILIVTILFIGSSCDNEDDPSPNDNQCTYQGLTFVDMTNNINTAIPESDLTAHFFTNGAGVGLGQIEINKTTEPSQYFLSTDIVTLNAVGSGVLRIAGTDYPVTVTCQRAGTAVGDEFRFDIVGANGEEAEFCGTIDIVTP